MTLLAPAVSVPAPASPRRLSALVTVLVVVHLVLKALALVRVGHAPLIGDEAAYADGGRALSNLLRDLVHLRSPDGDELARNVVGSGWFMPGMAVLLTPLFVIDPDASVLMIRGYLALLTTALLLLAVTEVDRRLGRRYAVALLVFPGLAPMWAIFSAAAWGDLCAGLVLVVLVARLVEAVTRDRPVTLREGLVVGLLAVAVVYLRSSTTVVLAGLAAVTLLTVWLRRRGRQRLACAGSLAAGGALALLLLLPWSLAASHVLGARVVTTTSVPTVLANTFGDPGQLCYGPCDPDSSRWFGPVRYAREVARATGRSELTVLAQMSEHARRDVTPAGYATDVAANAGRYAGEPARFARFLHGPGGDGRGPAYTLIVAVTDLLFYPALLAGLVVIAGVWRGPVRRQVLAALVTIGLIGLFLQPFVHISGGRYWTTAAPLLALAAALLTERRAVAAGDGRLTVVQAALTAVAAMLATVVAVGVVLHVA